MIHNNTDATALEQLIRDKWDEANQAGKISFRSETLTTKDLTYEGASFHLIHNACRDNYDRSTKAIDRPPATGKPFDDGSNPELARTEDGWFNVVGNRFACVQYQCVLAPVQPLEELTVEFLDAAVRFASEHPALTLMYNAVGAGKTVPAQFWLLSFARYDALKNFAAGSEPLCQSHGFTLLGRREPCYALTFDFQGRSSAAASLLLRLTEFMGSRNFNIFLHDQRVVFIPRENVEVPSGFENHRFGGLEMLGCFIMKSLEALESADPGLLLRGVREIGYAPASQKSLEDFVRGCDAGR